MLPSVLRPLGLHHARLPPAVPARLPLPLSHPPLLLALLLPAQLPLRQAAALLLPLALLLLLLLPAPVSPLLLQLVPLATLLLHALLQAAAGQQGCLAVRGPGALAGACLWRVGSWLALRRRCWRCWRGLGKARRQGAAASLRRGTPPGCCCGPPCRQRCA
ncbi:hypothetical protein COO60DRAFT_1500357 [Scenedesmus sp. NREL 46B-D3]|nr:hypothetical protein COO60DRAFT_1500357 [Scenedesmus sp. NREL 46B-D3]